MPFRGDPTRSLLTRLDAEVCERIEEAVDAACLNAMVKARELRGSPAPRSDNSRDREEYQACVRELLEVLAARFAASIDGSLRGRLDEDNAAADTDPNAKLLALQVLLAKTVPDYWQRFDEVSAAYTTDRVASGGEGRSFLGRFLGRG